ncbi:MAG: hypothetical protein ACYDBJ_12610 [Aggregatilineales bacterium]
MNNARPSTMLILFFSGAGLTLLGLMLMLSNFPTLAAPPAPTDVSTPTQRPQYPYNYNPYDGRVDPKAGDRVAVWCSIKYRDIDVWGTDEQSQGMYLATFNYDDVLAAGSDGQTLSAGGLGTVTLSVDDAFHFTLFWNGPYTALRHGDFQKSFTCVFLGGSFTPRPTTPRPARPRPIRTSPPVITVTPLPTATPFPTQSLY